MKFVRRLFAITTFRIIDDKILNAYRVMSTTIPMENIEQIVWLHRMTIVFGKERQQASRCCSNQKIHPFVIRIFMIMAVITTNSLGLLDKNRLILFMPLR